jgi:hypothetical protein
MGRGWPFRTSNAMRSLALLAAAVAGPMAWPIASAQTVDAWTRSVTLHPVGGDDTVRLQTAFDLCVALGPGCTVRLAAGTFYVGAIVSRGFDGIIAGAGQDVSVLEPLAALEGRPEDAVVTVSAGPAPLSTITFIGANVVFAAVSVHVPVVHLSGGGQQAAAAPRSGAGPPRRGGGGRRCMRTAAEIRLDDGRSATRTCA